MKFKPTRWKIIISIAIPLLIVILFLILTTLNEPMCHRGVGRLGKGEMAIDYWEECSIFEFM